MGGRFWAAAADLGGRLCAAATGEWSESEPETLEDAFGRRRRGGGVRSGEWSESEPGTVQSSPESELETVKTAGDVKGAASSPRRPRSVPNRPDLRPEPAEVSTIEDVNGYAHRRRRRRRRRRQRRRCRRGAWARRAEVLEDAFGRRRSDGRQPRRRKVGGGLRRRRCQIFYFVQKAFSFFIISKGASADGS